MLWRRSGCRPTEAEGDEKKILLSPLFENPKIAGLPSSTIQTSC
jgi:hypothetical protein